MYMSQSRMRYMMFARVNKHMVILCVFIYMYFVADDTSGTARG